MKCDNVNSMSSLRDIFTQNHYVKSIREFITQRCSKSLREFST